MREKTNPTAPCGDAEFIGVASARMRKPKNLENFGCQGISGDLE
jgi:hypothetical protein